MLGYFPPSAGPDDPYGHRISNSNETFESCSHNVQIAGKVGRDTIVGGDPAARGRLARAVGDNICPVALQDRLACITGARNWDMKVSTSVDTMSRTWRTDIPRLELAPGVSGGVGVNGDGDL